MSTTMTARRMTNPHGPATERQIEMLRHLAGQFYTPADVERAVAMATDKAAASDLIDKMIGAGGTKPPRQDRPKPHNNKATDRQVDYALSLLRRGGWHDSDLGQLGGPPPTEGNLRRMTRREISELINELKAL